jgi:trans-aconitate methyltransferase
MEIKEAIDLIRFTAGKEPNQDWADLGCGNGLFTRALASLLPAGSRIHAIDADEKVIREIPGLYNGVAIEKSALDFTSGSVVFHQMNGIMMANSLHYVEEKEPFLKRMIASIKIGGYFLLVDYDMERVNRWVPYPLPIATAEQLFLQCGAQSFKILNNRKSVFGDQWMYAALIVR